MQVDVSSHLLYKINPKNSKKYILVISSESILLYKNTVVLLEKESDGIMIPYAELNHCSKMVRICQGWEFGGGGISVYTKLYP